MVKATRIVDRRFPPGHVLESARRARLRIISEEDPALRASALPMNLRLQACLALGVLLLPVSIFFSFVTIANGGDSEYATAQLIALSTATLAAALFLLVFLRGKGPMRILALALSIPTLLVLANFARYTLS